jgi:hypothetical protein
MPKADRPNPDPKAQPPAAPAVTGEAAGRPPRTRSPNYPAVSLKEAVTKAREIYDSATKRHAVGVEVIASVWGNKPKSSTFKITLAAMQYFGLLAEAPNGEHRLLKLTPLALDIIADYAEGSAERSAAIQKAALLPKIHAELWKRWGAELPPDGEIRRYLVRERGFNDNTVAEFIKEYKDTLSFAKLGTGGKITGADTAADGEHADAVKVGDFVQWASQGADQWREPKRVAGFSPDGEYAFIDGEQSAVPVEQLTVETPKAGGPAPVPKMDPKTPPLNPHYTPPKNEGAWGVAPITFPLPRGNLIEIRLKKKVTPKEFEKIKQLLDLSEMSFVYDPDEADELIFKDKS